MNLKQQISVELVKAVNSKEFTEEKLTELIEVPPSRELGDYSFPCFKLSKELKKDPKEIALNLKQKIESKKLSFIKKTETKGPYLNFFLDYSFLANALIPEVLKQKNKFGLNSSGKKKKIMVEYSSPNTNKPLHIGHLRNDSIGMSLSNIIKANGFDAVKAILINDRGVHISKSMLAYQKFGKGKTPNKKSDHFVGDYYVLFNQKAKQNSELEKEALGLLEKWEKKDKKTIALWKKMNAWALQGIFQTYKKFGSEFDVIYKESEQFGKAKKIIDLGMQKKVFIKDSEKNIIVDLEKFNLGKKVVLRKDGTSIYLTNDLVLSVEKFNQFKLEKNIWVVGSEQKFYFQQLFKTLELLGFNWVPKCLHYSYGMVYLPEGKMKSREGKVVDADDLIKELIELAKKELQKRNPSIKEKELNKRAETIGLGAIKFFLLKTDAVKDINFNPEESISFEGETASFIQYAFARCTSILRKTKKPIKYEFNNLTPEEENLISVLSLFPEKVVFSFNSLSPHILCHYLLELTSVFNVFYQKCNVLNEEKNLM
ncbi:arginine--tRNA ligase, partial [Candidatus Micrarchaeota archaeon]|nr:arginine--tRNA ligase [Candidatus Micrarchaeota archaeon]